MIINNALECTVYFLAEKRNGLYEQYCPGVMQVKNMLRAENIFAGQAVLVMGRCGA